MGCKAYLSFKIESFDSKACDTGGLLWKEVKW